MFDRSFFETVLIAQVNDKAEASADGAASVKLRLASGETFYVWHIPHIADTYAVFEVVPARGKARRIPKEDRRPGGPLFDLDRLALPYGVIVGVEITTAPQGEKHVVGFHIDSPD